MSIYDYLRGYSADRFHTPGHKGGLDPLDITEIEGEFPGSIITDAEKETARLYGAENLRYLVGGSSAGMKAALLALRGNIVSESYRHRCVDEGAALAGVKVYTVKETAMTGEDGLNVLPDADSIARALTASGADAAVIQYPDYYGRCADLESIYARVRGLGKSLIVDSAHGAHFAFRPDLFPKSASLLSDACNLSAHKTLPAYTQTAYLAFTDSMRDKGIDRALELLGTTSPNYVFMAQLEKAASGTAAASGEYDRLKREVDSIKSRIKTLANDDFTRLVADCGDDGELTYKKLRAMGITAEKYGGRYVIFIITPSDGSEKIARLKNALCGIQREK